MKIYGKEHQLQFDSEEEFYETIGFLCNENNANITIEDNASRGSYTDAYRIKIKNVNSATDALINATRNSNRVNCNEFIQELMIKHKFYSTDNVHIFSDYDEVLSTIPDEYKDNFDNGFNK